MGHNLIDSVFDQKFSSNDQRKIRVQILNVLQVLKILLFQIGDNIVFIVVGDHSFLWDFIFKFKELFPKVKSQNKGVVAVGKLVPIVVFIKNIGVKMVFWPYFVVI